MWIALEALEAPLLADWTEHFDSHDRVFFYHALKRASKWTHPLEYLYREAYTICVDFQTSNLSLKEKEDKLRMLQKDIQQFETFTHQQISQWTEHTDVEGNHFYFNRQERQSTWTDPRLAFCNKLYLNMKTLRLLQSEAGVTRGFQDTENNGVPQVAPCPGSQSDDHAFDFEASVTDEAAAVGNCISCLNASATHVIVPCGHQAFCEECARKFKKSKRSNCLCCRTRITQIIKVSVPAPCQIIPKRPEVEFKKTSGTSKIDNHSCVSLWTCFIVQFLWGPT
mmetsp:Transcript_128970/g.223783  ORF Transcript_128970/g.223783 Transcript_128970/m.223783 type:complete len:281 (-) Transcript_128970:84-926(-)